MSEPHASTLYFDYQPEVDLLFAWIGDPQPATNVEVESGVVVRFNDANQVIGIEIIDCAARFGRSPESIDSSFVQAKIKEYAAPALAALEAERDREGLSHEHR